MKRSLVLLISCGLLALPLAPRAATFTVTNTDDSGPGSLRQAIEDANANAGPDNIHFNIAPGGLQSIAPNTALPDLTGPATIDGTTQPGYAGTPVIELSGVNVTFSSVNGLQLTGGDSVVRGLVINRFQSGAAISLSEGGGNQIEKNFIGTDPNGINVVGNSIGVQLLSSSNVIGGATTTAGNLIAGNGMGIYVPFNDTLQANSNRIEGNSILNNTGQGIYLESNAHDNMIGRAEAGFGNVIAFNAQGIFIAGTGNAIRGNSIYANTSMGIELNPEFGVNPNDEGDADTGANGMQNFPVLTSGTNTTTQVSLSGTLNSQPNTTYQLDFFANAFCDSSGHGEGQQYLGSTGVTTDGSGNVNFSITIPVSGMGPRLTATATDPDGNTSEFAACLDAVNLVPAMTFTVTNTNDSGPGSLRAAIIAANEAVTMGPDVIEFNILPVGVQTIVPTSALPVSIEPLIIDGTTQPGFAGSPIIELDGSNAGGGFFGTNGLTLTGGHSTVRGLVINRFTADGIYLSGGGTNTIVGNIIGLDVSGTIIQANSRSGISLASSHGNIVGGTTPADRNIVSGNSSAGIDLTLEAFMPPSSDNVIQGNYIGRDITGTTNLPNGTGISIAGTNNIIGGATVGAGNLIAGNGTGIRISGSTSDGAHHNRIEGNTILRNFRGVNITSLAHNNFIGGTNSGAGNIIAFQSNEGVWIQDSFATNNAVRGNSIHSSDQSGSVTAPLGIDLITSSFGVTTNDPGDPDSGPNQFQNFPVLLAATNTASDVTISGTLNSTANTSFELDFFSSVTVHPSGFGEGQKYLGSATVMTDGSGNVAFTATFNTALEGAIITSTATDAFGNTSEFSQAITAASTAPGQHFTVVNTNDSGPGSLRAAIEAANTAVTVGDTIEFNIPGPAPHTIAPRTPLPTVSGQLTIDGTTEPDFADAPIVELAGNAAGAGANGLLISGEGTVVRGLVINRFTASGIFLRGGGKNRIEGNYIGLDTTGSGFVGNSGRGILISNSVDNVVGGTNAPQRNHIANSGVHGVEVLGANATRNLIAGNMIGLSVTGADLGNLQNGVLVSSPGNVVGPGNVISGNDSHGVNLNGIAASNNIVLGNVIGLSVTDADLGNSQNGILVSSPVNVVGPGNVISGNDSHGVNLNGLAASNNVVLGNLIGTTPSGTVARNNSGDGVVLQSGARWNLIGGTNAAARNLLSGNTGNGVQLTGATTVFNAVLGNLIGADISGQAQLRNNGFGVLMGPSPSGASSNRIGGVLAGEGNVIAFSLNDGVFVSGGTGNSIRGNNIFSNTTHGIDIGGNGTQANDQGDGDNGANGLQNYPVLLTATNFGGSVVITGTLNSGTNRTYALDFYASTACDTSGNGEGQQYLGSTDVATDANGNAAFSVNLAVATSFLTMTATATDTNGNTSEFSACVTAGSFLLPTLAVNDAAVIEGDSGTTNLAFTVSLSEVSSQTVTVDFFTTNGTATAGTDYTATNGTLTFTPGQSNQTIFVTVFGDLDTEPHETLFMVLTNPANATFSRAQGQGTILDDNDGYIPPPLIAYEPFAYASGISLNGLNGGSGWSNAWSGFGVTTITAPGLTYVAGSSSLAVSSNASRLSDPGFTFHSRGVQDLARIKSGSVYVSFLGEITAGSPNISLYEGASQRMIIGKFGVGPNWTAAVLGVVPRVIESTVPVSTKSLIVLRFDYSGTDTTVRFYVNPPLDAEPATPTGQTNVTGLRFDVIGLNSGGPSATATFDEIRVASTWADSLPLGAPPPPQINVADAAILESNSGTNLLFNVSLTYAYPSNVMVNFATSNGTAIAGSDYVATNGVLTFIPGETNKTIVVPVVGDAVAETNEVFSVFLSNAVNGVIQDGVAIGIIVDEDTPPRLAIGPGRVFEGDSGITQAVFRVRLDRYYNGTVSVDYATTNGSATAGVDYVATNGTVAFGPGEIVREISVTVFGDTEPELNETFLVRLTNLVNAFLFRSVGPGLIGDDDTTVTEITVITLLANGDPVPGEPGRVFKEFIGAPVLNVFKEIAFVASTTDTGGANGQTNLYVWLGPTNELIKVAGSGMSAPPDLDGNTNIFTGEFALPNLSDQGFMSFFAGFQASSPAPGFSTAQNDESVRAAGGTDGGRTEDLLVWNPGDGSDEPNESDDLFIWNNGDGTDDTYDRNNNVPIQELKGTEVGVASGQPLWSAESLYVQTIGTSGGREFDYHIEVDPLFSRLTRGERGASDEGREFSKTVGAYVLGERIIVNRPGLLETDMSVSLSHPDGRDEMVIESGDVVGEGMDMKIVVDTEAAPSWKFAGNRVLVGQVFANPPFQSIPIAVLLDSGEVFQLFNPISPVGVAAELSAAEVNGSSRTMFAQPGFMPPNSIHVSTFDRTPGLPNLVTVTMVQVSQSIQLPGGATATVMAMAPESIKVHSDGCCHARVTLAGGLSGLATFNPDSGVPAAVAVAFSSGNEVRAVPEGKTPDGGQRGSVSDVSIMSVHNAATGASDLILFLEPPLTPLVDFGDTPDGPNEPNYPTTSPRNGARHIVRQTGPRLGQRLDADSGLLQNFTASADDEDQFDDEDGITFLSRILPGCPAQVLVVASTAAKLDAWIDFNQDGDWDDQGEKIFNNVSVVAGNNILSFTGSTNIVRPGGIVRGLAYARFRLSTAGNLNYFGLATDGEVEDHIAPLGMVLLVSPGSQPQQASFSWQDACELYVLQHTPQLNPPNWQDVSFGTLSNGVWYQSVNLTVSSGYYRLRLKP